MGRVRAWHYVGDIVVALSPKAYSLSAASQRATVAAPLSVFVSQPQSWGLANKQTNQTTTLWIIDQS